MRSSNVTPIWLPNNSGKGAVRDKVYLYTVVFEDSVGTDSVTHTMFGHDYDDVRARVENMFKAGNLKGVPSTAPDVKLVAIKVQLAGKESYSTKYYKTDVSGTAKFLNKAPTTIVPSKDQLSSSYYAAEAPSKPGTEIDAFDLEKLNGVYKVMTVPKDITARTYTKDMHKKGERMFPLKTDAAV